MSAVKKGFNAAEKRPRSMICSLLVVLLESWGYLLSHNQASVWVDVAVIPIFVWKIWTS